MLDSGRNPAWLADCGRRADNTARPLGNLSQDALLVIKVAQLDGVLAARCSCPSVVRLKTGCYRSDLAGRWRRTPIPAARWLWCARLLPSRAIVREVGLSLLPAAVNPHTCSNAISLPIHSVQSDSEIGSGNQRQSVAPSCREVTNTCTAAPLRTTTRSPAVVIANEIGSPYENCCGGSASRPRAGSHT